MGGTFGVAQRNVARAASTPRTGAARGSVPETGDGLDELACEALLAAGRHAPPGCEERRGIPSKFAAPHFLLGFCYIFSQ